MFLSLQSLMHRPAPRKSLGQNFLTDRNIAAKIVRQFAPGPDDVVLEIGPGQGALTGLLLESGCRLVAVELDPRMTELIREAYGDRLEVIEKDVLTTDLREIATGHGADQLRVIGNIPYYITSPILFHMIEQRHAVRDAVVMMQREVAERLVATPRTKSYGILSVVAQTYGTPRILFNVGPKCFFPPPSVTSAVVAIEMRDTEGIVGIERAHRAVVRTAFNQRRKTLRNALAQLFPQQNDRERIFQQAGIEPTRRAEELSTDEFIRLARAYASGPATTCQDQAA